MTSTKQEKPPARLLSRRRVLIGGGLIGALVVGYTASNIGTVASAALSVGAKDPDPSAFGPFIKIGADGWVTVVNKHLEMGQGTHCSLAAMVAEELGADWDKIRIEAAPANTAIYKNVQMGMQVTAGSSGVANSWMQFRTAGAAARTMFAQAAAARWGVVPATIRIKDGVVSHATSQRKATFADLLAEAAQIRPPSNPVLKDVKDFTLIGTDRVRRKDTRAKINGTERFTQDVRLPNMLTAMVARSPRFGGKVASFDPSAARKVPGVVDVFEIPSGVAVVAEDTYAAKQGRDALQIHWNDTDAEKRSSADLVAHYRAIADGRSDLSASVFQSSGDAANAFEGEIFEASYDFPYLAHATMEPMNCVAIVDGWSVKLISGSQLQTVDQVHTGLRARVLPGMVEIETLSAGGSFGRRGNMTSDYVSECVNIARHVGGGRPVKLVWTREDDMAAGYYRPMAHHRTWIKCDAEGLPTAWRHHAVAQALVPFGPNETAIEGVKHSPYLAVAPVVDAKVFTPSLPIPPGFWRSVGHTHTAMVMEHTIDQLALRAKRDPAEYRRAIYTKAGAVRHLAALEFVCARAGWGEPLESGWARGLAVHESFGSVVAQIAEVSLVRNRPKVRRVVCVIDCGIAVSPDQVAAQMEGSICYGLSAALYGRVTFENGIVQETNFDTYQVLRMDETPTVETHIIPSTNAPSGAGEPGTPLIAPAVANAILALTGRATASLPFVT